MWGQIVFHLDYVLAYLMGFESQEQVEKYETKPLKKKLGDLAREMSATKDPKQRRLLRNVHQRIDQLSSDRNVVFHGLWGFITDSKGTGWVSVSKSHSRELPFLAKDLKALHERMIGAAEALDDAMYGLGIASGPQPIYRNRRQLWVPTNKPSEPEQPPKFRR